MDKIKMTYASGLGRLNSTGAFQGQIVGDTTIKSKLESGILADIKPTWAGIAISLKLNDTLEDGLSSILVHATSESNVHAFTCTSGSWNGVTDVNSKAPLYFAGDTITFYRVGSKAQIYLPVSDGLGASLSNANFIDVDCSIDFSSASVTYMQLIAGNGGTGIVKILGLYDGINARTNTISTNISTRSAAWTTGKYLALVEI